MFLFLNEGFFFFITTENHCWKLIHHGYMKTIQKVLRNDHAAWECALRRSWQCKAKLKPTSTGNFVRIKNNHQQIENIPVSNIKQQLLKNSFSAFNNELMMPKELSSLQHRAFHISCVWLLFINVTFQLYLEVFFMKSTQFMHRLRSCLDLRQPGSKWFKNRFFLGGMQFFNKFRKLSSWDSGRFWKNYNKQYSDANTLSISVWSGL